MKVSPEAVRLARIAGVSPIRLQRSFDAIDRWFLDGTPLVSGEPRGILNDPSLQEPPENQGA